MDYNGSLETEGQEAEVIEEESEEQEGPSSKAGFYTELLILTTLIILNALEFFHLLTPELDYLKKIISWSALGYLMYKASISHLFFGDRYPLFDATIVLGYFAMVINNLIHYARIVYENMTGGELVMDEELGSFVYEEFMFEGHVVPGYLARLYELMVENEPIIILVGMFIGFGIIGFHSFYVAGNIEIKPPSLLHALGFHGEPESLRSSLLRFFVCFSVLLGFFVVVFNIVMEWLAIAVDAPLIMLGLVFYFFAGNIGISERIEKISTFGEGFYEEFIELFKNKKTILWAVAGMLVLHLVTDIPNLMFPYLFGYDTASLYAGAVQDTTVWELIMESSAGMALLDQIMVWSGYILNILGVVFLLFAPAYIWYHIYKESEFDMNPLVFFLFGASVTYYLLDPAFIIEMVDSVNLLGVNMMIQSISPDVYSLLISLGVGLVFMASTFLYLPEKFMVMLSMIGVQLFFLRHMYFYLISSYNLYVSNVVEALSIMHVPNIIFMGTIGLLTVLFYSVGPIAYIVKVWR